MPKISIRPGKGPGRVNPQMIKEIAGIRGAYAASPQPHDHVFHLLLAGMSVAGSAKWAVIVMRHA